MVKTSTLRPETRVAVTWPVKTKTFRTQAQVSTADAQVISEEHDGKVEIMGRTWKRCSEERRSSSFTPTIAESDESIRRIQQRRGGGARGAWHSTESRASTAEDVSEGIWRQWSARRAWSEKRFIVRNEKCTCSERREMRISSDPSETIRVHHAKVMFTQNT